MIQKIQVGEKYNLVGAGSWDDIDMDVVVLGVTIYSQLNPQDIDLYADWFKDYGIDESVFEDMMKDDPYIYHCRKLASRDPVLETDTGEEVYIFPGLINYQTSSKLLPAKIIGYKITLNPFMETDDLYPYKNVSDGNIKVALKDLMRSMVYDGITTKDEERDILITEEEYAKLTESRTKLKSEKSIQDKSEESNIAEERAYMYSVMESNKDETERLRLYNLSIQDREKKAAAKWSDCLSLQSQLNRKEIVLKNKYSKVKSLIEEYNENISIGDKIFIPDWDDL